MSIAIGALARVSNWPGWWVPERNLSGFQDTGTSVGWDTRARSGPSPLSGSVTSSSTLRSVPAVLAMTRDAGSPRTNTAPENPLQCRLDLPPQATSPLIEQTLVGRACRTGHPERPRGTHV
jgi:hypothetical protein